MTLMLKAYRPHNSIQRRLNAHLKNHIEYSLYLVAEKRCFVACNTFDIKAIPAKTSILPIYYDSFKLKSPKFDLRS